LARFRGARFVGLAAFVPPSAAVPASGFDAAAVLVVLPVAACFTGAFAAAGGFTGVLTVAACFSGAFTVVAGAADPRAVVDAPGFAAAGFAVGAAGLGADAGLAVFAGVRGAVAARLAAVLPVVRARFGFACSGGCGGASDLALSSADFVAVPAVRFTSCAPPPPLSFAALSRFAARRAAVAAARAPSRFSASALRSDEMSDAAAFASMKSSTRGRMLLRQDRPAKMP